ncbi:MAG: hypothetical protein U0587_15365 [Candidatus Binatia bacterium]
MTQRTHNTGWHRCWQLTLPVTVASVATIAAVLWSHPGAWLRTAPVGAQNVGDGAPAAVGTHRPEVPAAQGNRPGASAFREPPRLLSEAEVAQGLAARHHALRQRFLAHEHRRSQDPPEDYAIPEPPPNAHVPPRPDAPGGELDQGGAR